MRTIKESCLDQMVLFGEESLRRSLAEFAGHYHKERNHQGMGNKILHPEFESSDMNGPVACRNRLGGMLNYYYRQAA